MNEPPRLPPKRAVADALLRGPSMFVHLDPRRDGVVVPAWFKKQHQLVLQLGLNMAVPIRDLDVTDEGVSGTLSFNRSPFWCYVPWSAVYALVGEDGRGMVWPDSVPPELPLAAGKGRAAGEQPSAAKPAAKPRPHLRVASAPGSAEQDPEAGRGEPAAARDWAEPAPTTGAPEAPTKPKRTRQRKARAAAGASEGATTTQDARGRRKPRTRPKPPEGAGEAEAEATAAPKPRRKRSGAASPNEASADGPKPRRRSKASSKVVDPLEPTRLGASAAPSEADEPSPGSPGPVRPPDASDSVAEPRAASGQPRKPRRKLPPYLRVIK